MIETTATYFDGISSVAHPVTVMLNEADASLQFTTHTGKKEWRIALVTYHTVGNMTELHCQNSIMEILQVRDTAFVKELKRLRRRYGHSDIYHRLIDLGWKIHCLIAVGIIALIIVCNIFVLPWMAEKTVNMLPESYDNRLGDMYIMKYISPEEVDSVKTVQLQQFAALMNFGNSRPLRFTLVNSSVVNAYALPNGEIVVYSGLLDAMDSYEELAGVLAHEAMHVNHRHSMKMLARDLSGYLFLSAVLSDVNGIMGVISQNVHTLSSLTYSREFETEADRGAVELLIANHIDPNGMTKLLLHLQKESSGFMPQILSTHPLSAHRITKVEELKKKLSYQPKEQPWMKKIFETLKK